MMMSMSPMVHRQGYGHGPGSSGGVSPGPGGGVPPGTPMSMQQQQQLHNQQQQQVATVQPPGGSVSLALLIDFIVQKTYNELTVMADLLPRKTDMERKHDIFSFSSRTRLLFTRLLALVKWGSSAAKVDKSVHIMAFLEKQSLLFTDTADVLARIARDTLVHARLPNFHVPAAVEVLTTGSYNRLPSCIRERIVPPDPITTLEKRSTLNKLNQVIQHRLITSELPVQMRNIRIEHGRALFHVDNEFEVALTVLGDSPNIPWKIIEIEILVEDKDIGDGMSLVHPLQVSFLHQLAQGRLETNHHSPLVELYDTLHSFAQSLQLEVLYTQALKLCRERLGDYLTVEEYSIGQSLVLGYWNELSSHDPKAELGYRISISVDSTDPAQPLGVTHQPTLPIEEAVQTVEGLRTNQLEKMLVQTVYLRSKNRLVELSKEISAFLSVESVLSGSPPVLSIPALASCLPSEQLLVTVNVHTGGFLAHVPQFETSPDIVKDIERLLNSINPDIDRLKSLLSDLRYWITERRCEKTLQHLPASAIDGISLLKWEEHPVLSRIGPHRLSIKFQKHPYAILIVEFSEKEDKLCEMEYFFYLIMVKKASADENEEVGLNTLSSASSPKFYLRPVSILPLDTFVATHGPSTSVEVAESGEELGGKRKSPLQLSSLEMLQHSPKKQKHTPYFVPELAHIVAMCDERLPFALLAHELSSRGVIHGGCMVEPNGTCLSIPIFRFLMSTPGIPENLMKKLHLRLDSAVIRSQVQIKGFKTWNLEFKFGLGDSDQSVAGITNPVNYVSEMALSSDDHIPKLVDMIMDNWHGIARLFVLLEKSKWLARLRQQGIVSINSFTWNSFTLFYGPGRVARANFMYSLSDKCYKVYFGGLVSHNPHTLLRPQLQAYLNSEKPWTLENLVKILHETYEPLCSLVKLPTSIQLGTVHHRPQLPVQTFILIPRSTCHVRLVYNNIYCLDVHFQPEGYVSIRDGAYSLFDKTQVLGDLFPTQGLKAFLSKYVDENAVFRRRSQSEDDNPPSPISTMMDVDNNTPPGGPGSSSSFLSKPQSPAAGRSNPHTPASPHIVQPTPTGFSPATSFANLASPPSLPHLSQPSPNPGGAAVSHHPAPSPSATHLPAPSPSGGPLSVPTPSPNPSSHQNAPGPGSAPTMMGHPSPFFHAEGSPAAVQSPWGIAGSPSMPRPSPVRAGHSPGGMLDGNGRANIANRVLPQRSWAGAIPTILTHDALDILCTPVTTVESGQEAGSSNQGYPCSPLERFLGCSNLRRQLQRIVQAEEHLTLLPSTELGVLLFRSDTMQFRVGLDPNNFQSLHLKITSVPEAQFQWNPEEIQLLETFFATKVVRPPFRPNGLAAFARMISLPARVIRDLVQIIRVQLIPAIVEQHSWKWQVQLCLTVPPSALPIIAPGMPAVVISQSKFLIYLLLTRIPNLLVPMETDGAELGLNAEKQPFIVAPLVHDMGTNCTQLAEKRNGPVPHDCAALSHHIKRFTDFTLPTMGMDCSLFPTVQDVMSNFVIPPEGQTHQQPSQPMPNIPPQMVRPPMQQMMSPAGMPQQQFGGGPSGPPMM